MTSPLERLTDLAPEAPDAKEFARLRKGGLAKCHDLRNKGAYEGDLDIDERILADLLAACGVVAKALDALKPL